MYLHTFINCSTNMVMISPTCYSLHLKTILSPSTQLFTTQNYSLTNTSSICLALCLLCAVLHDMHNEETVSVNLSICIACSMYKTNRQWNLVLQLYTKSWHVNNSGLYWLNIILLNIKIKWKCLPQYKQLINNIKYRPDIFNFYLKLSLTWQIINKMQEKNNF
jgi:hypothetical protein